MSLAGGISASMPSSRHVCVSGTFLTRMFPRQPWPLLRHLLPELFGSTLCAPHVSLALCWLQAELASMSASWRVALLLCLDSEMRACALTCASALAPSPGLLSTVRRVQSVLGQSALLFSQDPLPASQRWRCWPAVFVHSAPNLFRVHFTCTPRLLLLKREPLSAMACGSPPW
jgi:hypothetical protein